MCWRTVTAASASGFVLALTACGANTMRIEYEPGAHRQNRVATCLRERGRTVERFLNNVFVYIRLEVVPHGRIQYLGLEFYANAQEAQDRFRFLHGPPHSQAVRRIDNVVYDRPVKVRHPVFTDIEECIRSS